MLAQFYHIAPVMAENLNPECRSEAYADSSGFYIQKTEVKAEARDFPGIERDLSQSITKHTIQPKGKKKAWISSCFYSCGKIETIFGQEDGAGK